MKKATTRLSAFLTQRVVFASTICSVAVFLALLALAHPGALASAQPPPHSPETKTTRSEAVIATLVEEDLFAPNNVANPPETDAVTATFVVNTTADTQDVTPGDGICADSVGACSLRAAITESNALAGNDVITLPAGTYTETLGVGGNEDANAGGDFDLNTNITINGAGSATTFIQANVAPGTATNERVIHIPAGASGTSMNINNLTIRHGNCTASPCTTGPGLTVQKAGATVALTNVVITQNRFNSTANSFGGGVAVTGVAATVTLTGCNVSNNTVTVAGATNGFAGGIYNQQATVNIINSTVSGNSASSFHGGIRTLSSTGGPATTNITNSTISNNTALGINGGANVGQAGGLINLNGATLACTTNITGSTINGNSASGGTNSLGGGVVNVNASTGPTVLNMTNCTVNGNTADVAGGIYSDGAATTANIKYCTIASNTGTTEGGGLLQDTTAGGLTNLKSSIVADNTSALAPDIDGVITSQGYNHVENTAGGTFTLTAGDVTGSDPGLGALANNGGPTQTQLPGAPVLNTIPFGTNECGTTVGVDQRAIARPGNGFCEKGSVEIAGPTPTPTATPFTPTPTPSPTPTPTGTPTPTPTPIGCVVLYDQTTGTTGAGTSSQDFETANDAFDDQAADDFVVPAGQTWTIMQIFAVGSYFNGTGSMPGANIFFYNNSGTLPGSLIASFLNVAPVIDTAGSITVTIPNTAFTAGTYWISVQARMDFAAGGQWSWGDRAPQAHSPAAWQNPGQAFALGCATWSPRGATCGVDAAAPDQAFRLRGCVSGGPPLTPTPTPIPGPTPTPGPTPIWITLVSRLSDAQASAFNSSSGESPPAQSQTDFSPAHLSNSASASGESGFATGHSTSNSSITIDNSMGTVQISGDGSAHSAAVIEYAQATASAKLIVLNFTITTPSYGYSLTGQLSASAFGEGVCFSCSEVATAKLTAGSTTLFEVTAGNTAPPSVTLAQTGTLSPGNYAFSVELDTHATGIFGSPHESDASSGANFNLALTPAATPTPGPTATATPSPSPVSISGAISYCSNPVPGPVPNVILTQTGDTSGSTLSDGSGSYQFSSIASGGSYTVTPTKADRAPGSAGINTLDVIAVQRHFLGSSPLTGCRLTAANVTPPAAINTLDVIAIQHFFLGQTTGIGNTGKYQFNPVNRTYAPLTSDQTGQNFDTIILGDVATPFVSPP